jgi:hypothetical protein
VKIYLVRVSAGRKPLGPTLLLDMCLSSEQALANGANKDPERNTNSLDMIKRVRSREEQMKAEEYLCGFEVLQPVDPESRPAIHAHNYPKTHLMACSAVESLFLVLVLANTPQPGHVSVLGLSIAKNKSL